MDDQESQRLIPPSDDEHVWNVNAGPSPSGDRPSDPPLFDRPSDPPFFTLITMGDLLSTSARAIAACFVPFVVITVVVTAPGMALDVAVQEWVYAQRMALEPYGAFTEAMNLNLMASLSQLGVTLVQTALGFLAHAALMYGTVEFLAGRRATIGQSLAGGFASAGSVLALSLLNTLAIGAALLACIIPGVIVMCVLFVAVPAAVVERLGPIEAMQRSADLTSGHRWTIFFALFVVVIAYLAFAVAVGMGMALAGLASGFEAEVTTSLGARATAYAVYIVLAIPLSIFQAVLAGVFYARARGVRDGVDADAIARVFA